jgi:hypothetical protein
MRPTNGVRFELRLAGEPAARAVYEVELALSGAAFAGSAAIEPESGQVVFAWQAEPPAWCESAVRAQLRTLYRERATGYPRRVTRWRPAPDMGSSE